MFESSLLTIVIPTRNRPSHCAAMVRFLRKRAVSHRIVVVDSSDAIEAQTLRAVCGDIEIRSFPPDTGPTDKFIAALEAISSPYAVMIPDDDITLPHAIDACLAHLVANPDAVAAQGYTIDLETYGDVFEFSRVRWFTPSVDQDDPLWRLYHLVRRYQPFFWAVFRTGVLLAALRRARTAGIIFFQEMTFMATAVILGKFARLPCIYMLRGIEESLTPLAHTHPFFALLADSDGFFGHYRAYRDNLAVFIEATIDAPTRAPTELRHMLNLIHAIYFRPALEGGPMEYAVQRLLDPTMAPIVEPPLIRQFRKIGWRDATTTSMWSDRRYLWRREVLNATPRDEITIDAEERARVVRALEDYQLDAS